MFDVVVTFPPGSRVRAEVRQVWRTNLHAHPNALEMVYVLAGTLHVKVSSEDFDLDAGDYVVLNRLDPHLLEGSQDNVTAVVHADLAAFRDVDPFVDRIMFACESFDLARHRRQEALLRGLLLDVVDAGVVTPDAERLDARGRQVVDMLCHEYSIQDYYQRDQPLSAAQRARLHAITATMRAHLDSRDVLADVAAAHHYSKSYVSHFVKKTTAMSFSAMVTAQRVMLAERLLLTTDLVMRDVSARCGFSDVKYFTRCFADWFKRTPAEYRTVHRPLLQRDELLGEVDAQTVAGLLGDHRSRVASPTEPPRLSVTPITLKNVGSRHDLFDSIGRFTGEIESGDDQRFSSSRQHLLPMRIGTAEVRGDHLLRGLASFADVGATPRLVVEFAGQRATLELLATLARRLGAIGELDVVVWLVYPGLHARAAVDAVIDVAEAEYGLNVQAVLVG